MKRILLDSNGRLRNGWWIVIFVAFVGATRVVYKPLSQALAGIGGTDAWREPLPYFLMLLATWACLRLRRETLAHVGLRSDRRWFAQLGAGVLVGGTSMLVIALIMLASGSVQFELDAARSAGAATLGLWTMIWVALFEELLFRGFVFQRLVDGAGIWIAQLAMALLFAAGHWDNPGLEGAATIWATIDIALGALIYGLAYLRTRSLALPIGMHFGWNVVQGHALGFAVSGHDQAGWLQPVLLDRPDWLTGGAFGPEASAVAVLVDVVVLAALWRWKGTAGAMEKPRAVGRDATAAPAMAS